MPTKKAAKKVASKKKPKAAAAKKKAPAKAAKKKASVARAKKPAPARVKKVSAARAKKAPREHARKRATAKEPRAARPRKTTRARSVAPVAAQSVAPVALESVALESVAPESIAPESIVPESVAPESVAPIAPRVASVAPGVKVPTWTDEIHARLALLRKMTTAAGGDTRVYEPAPPLSEQDVAAFEHTNGITLPADYRDFLREVGNGGFGPDYGVRPLAAFAPTEMPSVSVTVASRDGDVTGSSSTGPRPALARAAEMKRPFALEATYKPEANGSIVLAPLPADAHLYDGCLELAEIGCGYSHLLVVTGPKAGEVWQDTTAASGGELAPESTFRAWLDGWLDRRVAWTARDVALRLPRLERPAHGRAALAASAQRVYEVAERDPSFLSCAGHVRLVMGDREGALAALSSLEARDDRLAPELRAAIYAQEIARAREKGAPAALATHAAREVRLALAANGHVSVETLEALTKDPDVDVRALAARNPKAPGGLIADVARDGIAAIGRGALGLEAAMVVELALRHSTATSGLVEEAVAAAFDARSRVAAIVLRGAALSHACTDVQRGRLVASRWPEVRHAVAAARATPMGLVEWLATDESPGVRAAVGARRDVASALLTTLSQDAEQHVRAAVAANTSTPPVVLAQLLLDQATEYFARNNPRTPAAAIAACKFLVGYDRNDRKVDKRDVPEVRAWADEEDMDHAASTMPAVDAVAARKVRHWSFPVAALLDFISGHMGAYNMAGHPFLDAELIARIATDSYSYARGLVADRSDTPALLLERLARDPSEIARRSAGANPRLPRPPLLALLSDPVDVVREAAALNPSLPPEHLEAMASDPSDYARRGVARSPNAPPVLLAKLAKDKSHSVRSFVAYARNATPAILDVLATDEDRQTAGRVAFRRAVESYLAGAGKASA